MARPERAGIADRPGVAFQHPGIAAGMALAIPGSEAQGAGMVGAGLAQDFSG